MRPPEKFLLPVADGFKNTGREFGYGQLIASPFGAIDGDEINFPVRIYPRRNRMWQVLGTGGQHAGRLGRGCRGEQ